MGLLSTRMQIEVLVCSLCTTVHGSVGEADDWGCNNPFPAPRYAIDDIVAARFYVPSVPNDPFPHDLDYRSLRSRVQRILTPAEFAYERGIHADDGKVSRGVSNDTEDTCIAVTSDVVPHQWFYFVEPIEHPHGPEHSIAGTYFKESDLTPATGGTT